MSDILYSEEHEWVRVKDGIGTCGISDFAQEQLGDVVFVELPEVGRTLAKDEECAVVESVKAASEIFAPVSGEVVEVNEVLGDTPETVNASAEDEGWFFRIELSDKAERAELMNAEAYAAFVDENG